MSRPGEAREKRPLKGIKIQGLNEGISTFPQDYSQFLTAGMMDREKFIF
jgi:hypothetical protein